MTVEILKQRSYWERGYLGPLILLIPTTTATMNEEFNVSDGDIILRAQGSPNHHDF